MYINLNCVYVVLYYYYYMYAMLCCAMLSLHPRFRLTCTSTLHVIKWNAPLLICVFYCKIKLSNSNIKEQEERNVKKFNEKINV